MRKSNVTINKCTKKKEKKKKKINLNPLMPGGNKKGTRT